MSDASGVTPKIVPIPMADAGGAQRTSFTSLGGQLISPVSETPRPDAVSITGTTLGAIVGQKIDSKLLLLLNKLNLSREIISGLINTLGTVERPIEISKAALSTGQQPAQLSELDILREEELSDPHEIKSALLNFRPEKIAREIKAVREYIKFSANFSFEEKQAFEEIAQNIKIVLKELGAQPQAKVTEGKLDSVQVALNEKENIESAEKLRVFERALDKLISSKELSKVILHQLDNLRPLEEVVKKLLVSPSHEGQIETLLRVLSGIDTKIRESDTEPQRLFKEFINNFKAQLSNLSENGSALEIKAYLLEVLEKIYEKFELVPIEQRILKPDIKEQIKNLNSEQLNTLKLVEAQIKIILQSPTESLLGPAKIGTSENFPLVVKSDQLKVLLEMLEDFNSETRGGVPLKEAVTLEKSIRSVLETYRDPKTAEVKVRELLNSFQSTLTATSAPELTQLSDLRLIADLVLEFVSGSLAKLRPEPATQLLKLLDAESLKNLIAVLKRWDQSIPSPDSTLSHEMADMAGDLLHVIEKDLQVAPRKVVEQLKRTLENIEARLAQFDNKADAPPLSRVSAAAVRALESAVAASEAAQKINPILKSVGEPVILFFPFFVQGLISKLEVRAPCRSVVKKESHERENKKKNGSDQSVKFKLTLPNLGAVEVNVIYNSHEIFIGIFFENDELAAIAATFLAEIELAAKKIGFDQVYIVASGRPAQAEESWVLDAINMAAMKS